MKNEIRTAIYDLGQLHLGCPNDAKDAIEAIRACVAYFGEYRPSKELLSLLSAADGTAPLPPFALVPAGYLYLYEPDCLFAVVDQILNWSLDHHCSWGISIGDDINKAYRLQSSRRDIAKYLFSKPAVLPLRRSNHKLAITTTDNKQEDVTMTIEKNGTTFNNVQNLKFFLDDHCKLSYDLNAYLDDVVRTVDNNGPFEGRTSYELPPSESRSGHPETIGFDVEHHLWVDGQEVAPYCEIGRAHV